MPNCFQMFRRDNPGVPVAFSVIDVEMCKYFNVPVSETRYYLDWYNLAGFRVVTGYDLPTQIKEGVKFVAENPDDEWPKAFLAVLHWLDDHYTTNAFIQIGK